MNTFIFKALHYKVLYRVKSIFRKRRRTQAILVANHHQLIIKLSSYVAHVLKYVRIKFQFAETIYLVSRGGFFYQRTIPVYKQYFLHTIKKAIALFTIACKVRVNYLNKLLNCTPYSLYFCC